MVDLRGVEGYETFVTAEPVTKGWSGDRKYHIQASDGRHLLLRLSDAAEYERKKAEFEMLKLASTLNIPMSHPIAFGRREAGGEVYTLLSWCHGQDLEAVLPHLPEQEQAVLGMKSGRLLKKIHSIPAPEDREPWHMRFGPKVDSWIARYHERAAVHSDTGAMLVRYLEENRGELLAPGIQTLLHGDYNTENIIAMPDGEVGVIDFNSYSTPYGNPWCDLNNMAWSSAMYPYFYSGQLWGYFGGPPPRAFWPSLSYYLAYNALAALTDPYDLNGIEDGSQIVSNILAWTNRFTSAVPSWYRQLEE